MIRVAILEPDQYILDGIRLMVNDIPKVHALSCHTQLSVCLETLKVFRANVLIINAQLVAANDFAVFKQFKRQCPRLRMIVLGNVGDGPVLASIVEHSHINACVMSTASQEEWNEVMEAVADQDAYYSNGVLKELRNYRKMKQVS